MLRRLQKLVLLGVLALTVFGLVACGDDDADDATDTTPTATEAAAYPVTVTDLLGRSVTIDAQPERIVTASPSALELLADVGGTAIARSTTAVGTVEGAEDLEDIGPSYAPSFEQIVALDPDLVIADASAQAHLVDAFEGALGDTPVIFVGARAYADLAASARLLGTVLDDEAAGEESAAAFEAVADEVGAEPATGVRTLVLVAGRDGTLSAALSDSFIGDLVRLLGAENVAADTQQSGPVPGYALLSPESILTFDPDVVLVITPGGGPSMVDLLGQQLPELRAVQDGTVYEIDLEVFLQAPGPRAREGLRELHGLLQGG